MDFIDELRRHSTHVSKFKDTITTEAVTKNSLILPFFQLLGYNVLNHLEFEPEYDANFGGKKDAKVDYAIIIEEKPTILIECKPCGEDLEKHVGQLSQYYAAAGTKFGILTDGVIYNFYTDIDKIHIMDKEPFLVFDVLNFDENNVPELERFAKKTLDVDVAFKAAIELKYMGKINEILHSLRTDPQDSFVKYIIGEISNRKANAKAIEEFRLIIKRGFSQYINDTISEMINDMLKSTTKNPSVKDDAAIETTVDETLEQQEPEERMTTLEEFEAFAIVKSILRNICDVNRLTLKHTSQYSVVEFDNNSWKRICRFWFGGKQKRISIPDENKKPIYYDISNLNDIYKYADSIREVCERYL